jgi:hypothetical protein
LRLTKQHILFLFCTYKTHMKYFKISILVFLLFTAVKQSINIPGSICMCKTTNMFSTCCVLQMVFHYFGVKNVRSRLKTEMAILYYSRVRNKILEKYLERSTYVMFFIAEFWQVFTGLYQSIFLLTILVLLIITTSKS